MRLTIKMKMMTFEDMALEKLKSAKKPLTLVEWSKLLNYTSSKSFYPIMKRLKVAGKVKEIKLSRNHNIPFKYQPI